MPIDHKLGSSYFLQRELYKKGGFSRWYWDYRDNKILGLISQKHTKIMDIGCGEGILMEKLKKNYPNKKLLGLDPLEENVEICKKHNLPAERGTAYDLKKYYNSTDLVIFSEVLEHLEEPKRALKNISESLVTKGEAIIVVPNDLTFKIVRILFLKFKEAFADLGHLHQLTPRSTSEMLAATGFRVKKIINLPLFFWPISLHCIILVQKND